MIEERAPGWNSVAEAAVRLRLSATRVYELIALERETPGQGLKAHRVGRSIIISDAAIAAYEARRAEHSQPEAQEDG